MSLIINILECEQTEVRIFSTCKDTATLGKYKAKS